MTADNLDDLTAERLEAGRDGSLASVLDSTELLLLDAITTQSVKQGHDLGRRETIAAAAAAFVETAASLIEKANIGLKREGMRATIVVQPLPPMEGGVVGAGLSPCCGAKITADVRGLLTCSACHAIQVNANGPTGGDDHRGGGGPRPGPRPSSPPPPG